MSVKNYNANKHSEGWLVGGQIYGAYKNSAGVQIGKMRSFGFCDSVDITNEVTKAALYASPTGPRQKVREVNTLTDYNIQIVLRDTQPENVALSLKGEVTEKMKVTGDIDYVLAFAGGVSKVDGFFDLTTTAPVVTDEDGSVTYVEGMNYVVNDGSIYILEDQSGADDPIVEGEVIKVVSDKIKVVTIDAYTGEGNYLELYFEGENLSEGQKVKVEIFTVQLDPTDNYSIMSSEDFVTLTLNGSLLADFTRKDGSKYYKETRQA